MRAFKRWRSSLAMTAIVAAVGASIPLASKTSRSWSWRAPRPLVEKYRFAPVSRTVLAATVTANGELQSAKRTVIECELENITMGVRGQRLEAGGASVLLQVIPEGTIVQRGDVLARLDSSDYEELLRQQRITVERARSDHYQATLNLEVAKLAIHEYQEGVYKETLKDSQRAIALAESDAMRTKDRLDWTLRMSEKGYASRSQVSTEQQNYAKALFATAQEKSALNVYKQYVAPRELRVLEGQVVADTIVLNYQDSRLKRQVDRLAKLEEQVELCTIRAPHDGYVIYARSRNHGQDAVIEEGMSVRQKQDLFYLPDLNDMEVVTHLHESVVDQVRSGMKAEVRLEGFPDARLAGHVKSLSPLPEYDWRSDVRYFSAIVKLDSVSRADLNPGLTAEIEIFLAPRSNVLTVPVEAVTQEEGKDFCYVARDDRLERRRIELGQGTHNLLEVAGGLREGERVVLNPVLAEVSADALEGLDAGPAPPPPSSPADENDAAPADAVATLQ